MQARSFVKPVSPSIRMLRFFQSSSLLQKIALCNPITTGNAPVRGDSRVLLVQYVCEADALSINLQEVTFYYVVIELSLLAFGLFLLASHKQYIV